MYNSVHLYSQLVMKDEGLESYFSKVLRIEFRINSIELRIIDLISLLSRLFCLEKSALQENGILLGDCLTVKN